MPDKQTFYNATPIGNFFAVALNNRGQVVGITFDGRIAVWRQNRLTFLPKYDVDFSFALDINDDGTILAAAWNKEQHCENYYIIYSNGKLIKVNTPVSSICRALNNAEQIIGEVYNSRLQTQKGFVWQKGRIKWINNDGICTLTDINNRGVVTGWLWVTKTGAQPFCWMDGQLTFFDTSNSEAQSFAINDQGQTVGAYVGNKDPFIRPALWNKSGQMTVLESDNLPGKALDINNRDEVLGFIDQQDGFRQVTLWHNGSPTPLEDLINLPIKIVDTCNLQINNRGQILCFGELPNGQLRYFFLEPQER